MPYVFGLEKERERPSKKRRLSEGLKMGQKRGQEADSYEEGQEEPLLQEVTGTRVEEYKVNSLPGIRTSDREELIQCIKRGQRPTWVPKPGLEALCAEVNAENAHRTSSEEDLISSTNAMRPISPMIERSGHDLWNALQQNLDPIERPPSAFHSGDFREPSRTGSQAIRIAGSPAGPGNALQDLYSATPPPWTTSSPPAYLSRANSDSDNLPTSSMKHTQRSRAPSLGSSLSSSFVMRVPTSPLVHATNNPSLDFSLRENISSHMGDSNRIHRRRTMPPSAIVGLQMSPLGSDPSLPSHAPPKMRREASMPHQTHQSRRSLTSFTYHPGSSPQTPFPPRPRRLSHAADVSPRQRTSMVGSFEESILRGRMSTAPSKPLDFVAQIGVLGKGNCPPSLRCPAHMSVPFPAVFYSYPSAKGSRTVSDDSPSPYVGTIDLEQNLNPIQEPPKRKRRSELIDPDILVAEVTSPENTSIGKALAREAQEKQNKTISKAPAGGAYRVPEKGQLQIIIKNPNKTAVKLFLVPYDLEGMQPGTKTFVRQRSCSSGPIVENALSDSTTGVTIHDPLSDKRILRYLIHLKFCCLSKGRFYLYDNIRVVFANRVPEGKEKLQNEVQLPEPRFSPYNPGTRDSRRQSVSESFSLDSPPRQPFIKTDQMDGISGLSTDGVNRVPFASSAIPFHLVSRPTKSVGLAESMQNEKSHGNSSVFAKSSQQGHAASTSDRPQSPVAGFELPSTSARSSPISWSSPMGSPGPRSFSPAAPEVGDSLLSRKLREMSRLKQPNGSGAGDGGMKMGG